MAKISTEQKDKINLFVKELEKDNLNISEVFLFALNQFKSVTSALSAC